MLLIDSTVARAFAEGGHHLVEIEPSARHWDDAVSVLGRGTVELASQGHERALVAWMLGVGPRG